MSKRSAFNSDIVETETDYMLDFKNESYHWLLLNDFLSPRPPV